MANMKASPSTIKSCNIKLHAKAVEMGIIFKAVSLQSF